MKFHFCLLYNYQHEVSKIFFDRKLQNHEPHAKGYIGEFSREISDYRSESKRKPRALTTRAEVAFPDGPERKLRDDTMPKPSSAASSGY